MTTSEQWKSIAKRCEKAIAPDREIDAAICIAANWPGERDDVPVTLLMRDPDDDDWLIYTASDGTESAAKLPAVTGSLDQIVSLIERELPGWDWQINGADHKRKLRRRIMVDHPRKGLGEAAKRVFERCEG
jgi:hypothetical protein